MPQSIIKVEHLSKRFIISHEGRERYTSLRDVVTKKARKIISLPGRLRNNTTTSTKEEFWALKDVNFDIQQGDRVGIIGRNGAGKSTLLKILSRITEPSAGKITIKGKVASLLEVGTGFHPELTGRENIFLNGAILGMSRAEIRKKFDEIVAFAEVEKFLDTPVKRYSSGMYVRLAFAVAAHLEPEILIVDEVLAVGDAQFQKKCLGKMQDVSTNEGRTVLFVSHNMGVIAQLCPITILMKNGKLISIDKTRDIIDKYLVSDRVEVNSYFSKIEDKSKKIFIASLETLNCRNEVSENFQFDENINLRLCIKVFEFDSLAKISVTLQNVNGDYLSTLVEDLADFINKIENNIVELKIQYNTRIIAPNSYAFRIAIFTTNGMVYDLQEMICPIKIYDNGTKLSLFDGVNYGNFFIDYKIN